jgi:hypothetical protein
MLSYQDCVIFRHIAASKEKKRKEKKRKEKKRKEKKEKKDFLYLNLIPH